VECKQQNKVNKYNKKRALRFRSWQWNRTKTQKRKGETSSYSYAQLTTFVFQNFL